MAQSVMDIVKQKLSVNCEAKTPLSKPIFSAPRRDSTMLASIAEGGKIIG